MIGLRQPAEAAAVRAPCPDPFTGETQPTYLIGGQRWPRDTPGFAEAMARAYEHHLRPRCLCRTDSNGLGAEMYVTRWGAGYIVKRMPNTGSQHAAHCPSYEPPAELSGLGALLGSAIVENPSTGETTLKLDFPMSKLPGRSTQPPANAKLGSVSTQANKLTLRGLLHYLWDQADLTRWQPGFAGRRHWATVRRHLLHAAENKLTRGHPLRASLYIPEVFSVAQCDPINQRRLLQWAHAAPRPGASQQLMLLIAELKELVPARLGHRMIVKHVPDQAFAVDESLYRRLCRCFEREMALWTMADSLHMLVIATFRLNGSGIPDIVEMSLMPTTSQWIPIEDQLENSLVEKLVQDGRAFIKCLRYKAPASQLLPCASLIDSGTSPQLLVIARLTNDATCFERSLQELTGKVAAQPWVWRASDDVMPKLPLKGTDRYGRPTQPEIQPHQPVEPPRAATGQASESP